jgi:hypothetical protein
MTKTHFQYQPFTAADEIRLLRIPHKLTRSSETSLADYTLFHVSLDDSPVFTALSYTWGDPTLTEEISVNGHPLQITQSLATALSSIRSEDTDIILWADAICVNQKDLVERTAQVQLMHQVYRTAQRVLIWLGLPTDDTDEILQEFDAFGSELLALGMWDLTVEDLSELGSTVDCDLNADCRKQSHCPKQSLSAMARDYHMWAQWWWSPSEIRRRSWWSRIWCVQELSTAREAIFRCGNEEIDFKSLWAATTFIQIVYRRFLSGVDGLNANASGFHNSLWMLGAFDLIPTNPIALRRITINNPGHSLLDLLITCHTWDEPSEFNATDPRDRVYALLGMATDDAARKIVPDYTASCEDAYITTARVLLEHGYWEVLSMRRTRNVCRNLPTWVPDWSANNWSPWSRKGVRFDASHVKGTLVSHCKVVAASQSDLFRVISPRVAFVDTVQEAGRTRVWGCNNPEWKATSRHLETIQDYISRSLKYSAWQKEDAEWRLPVIDAQLNLSTSRTERASDPTYMQMYKKWVEEGEPKEEPGDILEACRRQMMNIPFSRPFLSTTGYVGLCSEDVEPGDEIVIVIGADVPYAVRPRDDGESYTLVGECHVYGIMYGEFMQQDPKPPVVNITLH